MQREERKTFASEPVENQHVQLEAELIPRAHATVIEASEVWRTLNGKRYMNPGRFVNEGNLPLALGIIQHPVTALVFVIMFLARTGGK